MAHLNTGHTHVFICGLHRSGTTILNKLVNSSKGASGFENSGAHMDEGQFLQDVFPIAKRFGGVGKFAFHHGAYMNEGHYLSTPKCAEKLYSQWCPYWELDKQLLIEKTPANIIRSRYFQSLFEDSKFIFIIRHPIATSFATQKWSRTGTDELFKHWLAAHRIAFEDMKHLENSMILSYEELVALPEESSNRIAKFLGTELTYAGQLKNANQKYFDRWNKEANHLIKQWHSNSLISRFEKSFNAFGYSLTDLSIYPKFNQH